MDRLNSEGIAPAQLVFALKSRTTVGQARQIDACLLCRRPRVNEAGLCDVCYTMLSGEAQRVAERWIAGVGP